VINIFNEYRFIVTVCDMIENDRIAKNYVIHSDKDYGAWTQCIAQSLRDLKGHESLYKIELIEVV